LVDHSRVAADKGPSTYAIEEHGNVLVAVCVDTVTVPSLERLLGATKGLALRSPAGVGVVLVLPPNAPLLSTKRERELASELLSVPGIAAFALVLEGDGFWAAAARSILVGLNALSRRTVPTKVFASIDQAAPWLYFMVRRPAEGLVGLATALQAIRSRATPRWR
jgi:hypothetical protein